MKLRWIIKSMTPAYWVQINTYSPSFDKHLNALLDAGVPFTNITHYNADIGGIKLWIANHPYGSFTLSIRGCDDVRPRRATIARAYEALKKQTHKGCEQRITEYLASKPITSTVILATPLTPEQLEANRKQQAEYGRERGFDKPGAPRL